MGANSSPQDVAHGLFEGNPPAGLIEGFCLTLDAAGDLESRPVVHGRQRRGVTLSAVEADQLATACQRGMQRQLAFHNRYFILHPEHCPAANEIAIALHPYGSGPFAGPAAIRNGCLLRGVAGKLPPERSGST
ncbi:hypothetical protein GCM10010211_14880 [Streptomyces albospinus]|uniref:Uncharacterized protein n=1 Tax=Streptomyces albospinus TaxID=285515 RepID=A0ABQ2UTU1_9ACTN|nr:coenzyme f390 synthetase [Streptomyces albospinus]GGU51268.1 hypothetical protein GCM10010211_14880 [Streptomyces albospinus]